MATFSNLTSLGDHVEKDDGRLQATGPIKVSVNWCVAACRRFDPLRGSSVCCCSPHRRFVAIGLGDQGLVLASCYVASAASCKRQLSGSEMTV